MRCFCLCSSCVHPHKRSRQKWWAPLPVHWDRSRVSLTGDLRVTISVVSPLRGEGIYPSYNHDWEVKDLTSTSSVCHQPLACFYTVSEPLNGRRDMLGYFTWLQSKGMRTTWNNPEGLSSHTGRALCSTSLEVLKAALAGVLRNLVTLQNWVWFEQGIRPGGFQRLLANEIALWFHGCVWEPMGMSILLSSETMVHRAQKWQGLYFFNMMFWCGPVEGKITQSIQKVTCFTVELLQPCKKWSWIACEANTGINLVPVWDQDTWLLFFPVL